MADAPPQRGARARLRDWRFWAGIEAQTTREKRAARSAISLFFGALIGANLGSLEALPLPDYALMIGLVSLIVLYMHTVPVARRRWETAFWLVSALGLLYVLLVSPIGARFFPSGAQPRPHLFVTICLWFAVAIVVELRPVRDDP